MDMEESKLFGFQITLLHLSLTFPCDIEFCVIYISSYGQIWEDVNRMTRE
jgi:hypothetical protein